MLADLLTMTNHISVVTGLAEESGKDERVGKFRIAKLSNLNFYEPI